MNLLAASPLAYFYDPVLRGPTIGCMLMCFAAALVGVIVFLRKQSLLGESLSHASYPGVICGVFVAGFFSFTEQQETVVAILIMIGAFFSALAGLWTIRYLEQSLKIRSDAALCFVLSAFFGIGLTLASRVQFAHPVLYRKVLGYLYGQAATMTDRHIWIYGTLSLFIAALVLFFYKEIQILTFDREYARTLGVKSRLVETSAFFLIVLAVVIGIRSVGVVLMSAMLIAPAVAARQFSNKLYLVFPLAGIFGLFSGFAGNYLSMEGSIYLADLYPEARLSLPTGPMIVLVASTICLIALFFAPERGLCLRLIRIARFRYRCLCENLLKAIWRHGPEMDMTFEAILNSQSISPFYLRWVLTQLTYNGWIIEPRSGVFRLTHDGQQWAAKIVRLHRLWEVYLADYLGVGAERVHRNAEEMEHIITPELEKELTLLLNDPKRDPHNKPIPPREEL